MPYSKELFNKLHLEKNLSFTKLSILVDYAVGFAMNNELNHILRNNNIEHLNDGKWNTGGRDLLVHKLKAVGGYNHCAYHAAKYSDEETLNYCIKKGANDWNLMAYGAASGGNRVILDETLNYGASDLSLMLKGAAGCNQSDVVSYLLELDSNLKVDAALCSIQENDLRLLFKMINSGVDDWEWLDLAIIDRL